MMSSLKVAKLDEGNSELLVLDHEEGKVSCGGDSGGKKIHDIKGKVVMFKYDFCGE